MQLRCLVFLALAACGSEPSYSWKWAQTPDPETLRPLLVRLRQLAHDAEVSAILLEDPPSLSWGNNCQFPSDGVCTPNTPSLEAYTQAVLIMAGEATPHDQLQIDSGRSWSDWAPGRELYKRVTDKEAPMPWESRAGVGARAFQVLLGVWAAWALLVFLLTRSARMRMPRLTPQRAPSGKVELNGHYTYVLDRKTLTRGLMIKHWALRRGRLLVIRVLVWLCRAALLALCGFLGSKPAGLHLTNLFAFAAIVLFALAIEVFAQPALPIWWELRRRDLSKVLGQMSFSFDANAVTVVSAEGSTQAPWTNARTVVSDDHLVMHDFGTVAVVIPRGVTGIDRSVDAAQAKGIIAFSAY
jgi:hypothetical protein